MSHTNSPSASANVVGIYTIKDEEFLAVLDRLGSSNDITGESGQRYKIARTRVGDQEIAIALFRGVSQGNQESQTLIHRAITDLSPSWMFVVGIAGGAPHKDFTIGDVVVASELLEFTYEVKIDDAPSKLHPRTLPLDRRSHGLVSMLPALLRQVSFWSSEAETRQRRPGPPLPEQVLADIPEIHRPILTAAMQHHLSIARTEPKAITGTVGSSNALMKSSDFLAQLTGAYKFLLCVEMESAGAYAACNTSSSIPLTTIRGISDIVGVSRSEEWTNYACQTAASLAVNLIRGGATLPAAGFIETSPSPSPAVSPRQQVTSSHSLAIENIHRFGDTDIFPKPYELGVLRDCPEDVENLLADLDTNFTTVFSRYPPHHLSTLSQVGYAGFRWASQLDPLYNAYLLSLVCQLGPLIESIRLPTTARRVFSYRFAPDFERGRLFDEDSNWDSFLESTRAETAKFNWIIKTDIADFYSRISHERLKTALSTLSSERSIVERISLVLAGYSKGSGVGLPVGGPAARLLSEAYLNASDHLLHAKGVTYCRFADDYILFAESEREGIEILSGLARILSEYDGLSLQKMKTRIMRKNEYLRSYAHEDDADLDQKALSFLRLRLRYDPYSPTANEDYETLRSHLNEFDILGMLAKEMRKSRLHHQLTKKLLYATRFIEGDDADSAALVIAESLKILLPVFSSAAGVLSSLLERLQPETRAFVEARLITLLESEDSFPLLEIHRMLAVRLLSGLDNSTSDAQNVIWRQYEEQDSILVQKECIWALQRLRASSLIAPLLGKFDSVSQWERRALLSASFLLEQEGPTFRANVLARTTPFEKLVISWCKSRGGEIFAENDA